MWITPQWNVLTNQLVKELWQCWVLAKRWGFWDSCRLLAGGYTGQRPWQNFDNIWKIEKKKKKPHPHDPQFQPQGKYLTESPTHTRDTPKNAHMELEKTRCPSVTGGRRNKLGPLHMLEFLYSEENPSATWMNLQRHKAEQKNTDRQDCTLGWFYLYRIPSSKTKPFTDI